MLRRDKHPVGVLESACIDTIEPDGEGFAECRARFSGRADEIRDDRAASFNNPIAHPAHAARVLDTIFMAKAEIARKIGAHGVGIEHHRVEQGRQRLGERRLAGSRQAHNKNFSPHDSTRIPARRGADYSKTIVLPSPL